MFASNDFMQAEIEYISGGLFVSDGAWTHPSRTIDSYELIFVVKGTVALQIQGQNYDIGEQEALFLAPGEPHRGIQPSNQDISFYWYHFVFPEHTPATMLDRKISMKNTSNLRILLRQLLHYTNTPRYPKKCSSILLQLAITEILLAGEEPHSDGNELVQRIQEYIRIHYDKHITLKDLEERFNYNQDYLSLLFKRHFHMGLKQYMTQVKMDKAKELIVSGMQLSDIPAELGITDYNLFLKQFKYHEGVTPKEFRNTYTNLHINKK